MLLEIMAGSAVIYASGRLVNHLKLGRTFTDDNLMWAAIGWVIVPGTLLIELSLMAHKFMMAKTAKKQPDTVPPAQPKQ